MFSISEETRNEAIEAMKAEITSSGAEAPDDVVLGEAFDAAVRIVAKSFGM